MSCRLARGEKRDRDHRATGASRRITLVEAVPVANALLAVLPAEIDHAAVAQVREIDEAEAEILGHPAQPRDVLEALLDRLLEAGDPLGVGPPRRLIDEAAAREGDALALALQPLASSVASRWAGTSASMMRARRGIMRSASSGLQYRSATVPLPEAGLDEDRVDLTGSVHATRERADVGRPAGPGDEVDVGPARRPEGRRATTRGTPRAGPGTR